MFDDNPVIWGISIAPSMAESNLILVNPPKKVKKMAARKGTKASRSAAAKKAAATRKRNAAKRSAAAKKAAATRKRNAGKKKTTAKRKASRSTASKRSAAAKKAAATRKRNAAKRSRAAKKAAATRKRNSGKRKTPAKRKSSSTKRSTKASRSRAAKKAAATRKRNASKRSRAAKKAAATRKRNSRGKKRSVKSRKNSPARRRKGRMTKAQRSAAAKKAWRTRRRNGNAGRRSKRTTRGRRRAKSSRAFVQKAGKNTYDSAMKAVNALPGYGLMAVYGAFAIGAYNAIKPMVWDRIGVESYVGSAADKIGQFTTANIGADIGNFTNKAIAVGTIAALGHLVSSKKALGLIDPKLTTSAVGIAGLYYGAKFISEIATLNPGNTLQALATGDFSGASNQFMAGSYGLGMSSMSRNNQLPMFGAHNNNSMGMMHGGHNLGMAMNGNKGLLNQMQTSNTAALQMGGNKSGFFGTGRSLGATRVNLF